MEQALEDAQRAQIVAAVLDEIARWGIDRFNVGAMAHRHGLDVSEILRHWPEPESLVLDALANRPGDEPPLPDTGTLRDDLYVLALRMAELVRSKAGRKIHGGHLITDEDFTTVEVRQRAWRARATSLADIFERARQRGELRNGVDYATALELLFAPINMRALYSGEIVDDDYCRTVADLVFSAVAA